MKTRQYLALYFEYERDDSDDYIHESTIRAELTDTGVRLKHYNPNLVIEDSIGAFTQQVITLLRETAAIIENEAKLNPPEAKRER